MFSILIFSSFPERPKQKKATLLSGVKFFQDTSAASAAILILLRLPYWEAGTGGGKGETNGVEWREVEVDTHSHCHTTSLAAWAGAKKHSGVFKKTKKKTNEENKNVKKKQTGR